MKFVEARGVRIPVLGFGTYGMADGVCARAVGYALEVGYRHIDTAQAYGSEDAVGRAVARSAVDRADVFITTKVRNRDLADGDLQRSVDASLGRLRTDYVDLLLIHWPSRTVPLGETLAAMARVKAAGKVRLIGVSNFTVRHMREAVEEHGAELLCNQVEYHPYLSQRRVMEYVRRRGMILGAYKPTLEGRTASDPVLAGIGRRYGKSGAQVALRWLVEQDSVFAITKAAKREHCLANLQIFDFALDDEDRAAIARFPGDRRLLSPSMAPEWDPL